MKLDAGLVRTLKLILQELVAARRQYPKRLLEQNARQARRLRCERWLAALDRAVGRSVQRKQAAAELLAKLTDLPEVADRFASWLKDDDLAWRAEAIRLVGEEGLHQFTPLLNDALTGGDDFCRAHAITAAGQLRSEDNLPFLLRMAADPAARLGNRLLWALKDYGHPLCRPALERVFREGRTKQDRVIAAWGLGKLGDRGAIRYLAGMLDEPAKESPTRYDPGESLRAAQALCDIHGWPFDWDRSWVEKTKQRWRHLGFREEDVAICVRQLQSRVEQEQVDAAQAICFFVSQADHPAGATRTALTALAASLGDANLKVRRAVANALADLALDAADFPDGLATTLTPALEDEDRMVRTRIAKVLKRLAMRICEPSEPPRRRRAREGSGC
jgi:HEAT repeat protein